MRMSAPGTRSKSPSGCGLLEIELDVDDVLHLKLGFPVDDVLIVEEGGFSAGIVGLCEFELLGVLEKFPRGYNGAIG